MRKKKKKNRYKEKLTLLTWPRSCSWSEGGSAVKLKQDLALHPRCSKRSPQTSCTSYTGQLVEHIDSQTHPRPTETEFYHDAQMTKCISKWEKHASKPVLYGALEQLKFGNTLVCQILT